MKKIEHQFLNESFFVPNWPISHLFLGTFNPQGGDKVNYFYGRKNNQTWKLLSEIFDEDFNPEEFDPFLAKIKKHKVACMDMIQYVSVPTEKIPGVIGKGYSDSNLINNKIKRELNTSNILSVINRNQGVKIYSTWGSGSNNNGWKNEVQNIPNITSLVSPSMAARIPKGHKKFEYMLENWSQLIAI